MNHLWVKINQYWIGYNLSMIKVDFVWVKNEFQSGDTWLTYWRIFFYNKIQIKLNNNKNNEINVVP